MVKTIGERKREAIYGTDWMNHWDESMPFPKADINEIREKYSEYNEKAARFVRKEFGKHMPEKVQEPGIILNTEELW